jgi:hypothetical protein
MTCGRGPYGFKSEGENVGAADALSAVQRITPIPELLHSEIWRRRATRQESQCKQSICVQLMTRAGIFTQSMGAKNRVVI